MVILGLLMLTERRIFQWQKFQNKNKVTSDMAKYHYEIGFIHQEMRILGHAIPAKCKINFPVICKKFAKNFLHYLGH